MLRRDRQKTKTVEIGNRRDRDAPIGAALGDACGHGVMRARLIGIARRLGAAQEAVDQDARAGAGIAIEHQNRGIGQGGAQCGFRAAAREARIAGPKHKSLHAPPARNEAQSGREQMLVVDAASRIDEMNRRNIAFAAACRTYAAKTADGDRARTQAALGQRADHDIERDVVTAHDDQIGRALGFSDQGDFDVAVGIERGDERIDGKKTIGLRAPLGLL
jgi:hypothetical protein